MARAKTPRLPDPAPAAVDETAVAVDAEPVPVDTAPAAPVHTRDRDPADREAWKRERARQLGHHR
ncbi:MAG: hypothetical protein BGP10_12415 [Rhodanobacter sp. 68-29]|nr:hypothetical protein [Rhodanobacter sp.]ODV27990.1 MAG: hypothetical protein ABT19_00335 [Rhodanobacter sp. SCN 68-63]OJY60694.1 MAG: hypothetical protein BGP10_12415 [Rhodanobacter sp. 68-29]